MGLTTARLSGPGATVDLEIVACGDSAALVTVEAADREVRWRDAHRIGEWIEQQHPPGLLGTIATYDTVLVEFDPIQLDFEQVVDLVRAASAPTATPGRPRSRRHVVVPVVYGGDYGPDLDSTAAELGLTGPELVRRHHAEPYLIRCVVSPAGAPMTDGPPLPRVLPRLATPRVAVPAGSVAVVGRQATIYPLASPGGWRLIGRTPVTLIDPRLDPPVRYEAGDQLRYVPIAPDEWSDYLGAPVEVVEVGDPVDVGDA